MELHNMATSLDITLNTSLGESEDKKEADDENYRLETKRSSDNWHDAGGFKNRKSSIGSELWLSDGIDTKSRR